MIFSFFFLFFSGHFYPCIVAKINGDGSYAMDWEDGNDDSRRVQGDETRKRQPGWETRDREQR